MAIDQQVEEGKDYDLALIGMESYSSVIEMISEIRRRLGSQIKIAVMVKEAVGFDALQSWKKAGVDCVVTKPISACILRGLLGEEMPLK